MNNAMGMNSWVKVTSVKVNFPPKCVKNLSDSFSGCMNKRLVICCVGIDAKRQSRIIEVKIKNIFIEAFNIMYNLKC